MAIAVGRTIGGTNLPVAFCHMMWHFSINILQINGKMFVFH